MGIQKLSVLSLYLFVNLKLFLKIKIFLKGVFIMHRKKWKPRKIVLRITNTFIIPLDSVVLCCIREKKIIYVILTCTMS